MQTYIKHTHVKTQTLTDVHKCAHTHPSSFLLLLQLCQPQARPLHEPSSFSFQGPAPVDLCPWNSWGICATSPEPTVSSFWFTFTCSTTATFWGLLKSPDAWHKSWLHVAFTKYLT